MDDVGMGPYEGFNFTAENARGYQAWAWLSSALAWIFISLFILVNLAAINFLLWQKSSEFICSYFYSYIFALNSF